MIFVMEKDVLIKQKHIPMVFLAAWLMVTVTIQWIMLDMYLPALPILVEEFGVTEGGLNVSLNAGIIPAAVATIIGGTLSDRYGRKPVMIISMLLAIVGCLCCALSRGVVMLSIMRGIAGIGSGSVCTVANAMLKDSFAGKRFQRNMTILQSVAAVGPIFAPALGSFLINISSWRFIFYFLAAGTFVTMVPMLISTETLPAENRFSNKFSDVLEETVQIAKTPAFSLFLGIIALLTIPIWAYVAVSSYVFITDFGLSNTGYGVYYAVGTAFSVMAPFIYLLLAKKLNSRMIVRITILLMLMSGVMLLTIGEINPVLLILCVVPMYFSEGIIRPLGLVILLDEYSYVAGSASALVSFVVNIVGAIGTALATIGWKSMIHGTGMITMACVIVAILFWAIICAKGYLKARLDK